MAGKGGLKFSSFHAMINSQRKILRGYLDNFIAQASFPFLIRFMEVQPS